jgi:DNA-binding transcriptional LysR family regulator
MRQLPDDGDLVARRLGRIAFAVYAASAECAAVIVPPEDPNLSLQAALIERFRQGRPVAARIGDMPIRYQATKAGLGAAVLPCWLGDSDPALVRVLAPPAEMVEDVHLVVHRRNRERAGVARAVDALAALFKREARALEGRLG